ncbi:MAG TPA: hypothetical protein VF698_02925 [Thermoanaerobaculia bacterium]|jgi:hypothetical protein
MTLFGIVLVAAAAQWIAFASLSAFSRNLRPRRLLASSVVFAVAWLLALDAPSLVLRAGKATQASVATTHRAATCSAVTLGMSESEVESRLGKPDEVRGAEETRGPGAKTWVYRDSRCALQMFEGNVEFIE